MDNNKQNKKSLSTKNQKWEEESAKIRKVQISLDFPDTADVLLRTLAAREHKAPSSMIREIVGMPSSPPKRARIGVSFNDDELEELGRRYGIDPQDKAEIRRRLTDEVTRVISDAQDLETEPESKLSKASTDGGFEQGALKDLQSVSDSIHARFQQALNKREQNKD